MPSGPDVLVGAFRALDLNGQREAFERCGDILALAQTNGDSEADYHLRQLRLAAEEAGIAGRDLTAGLYREATKSIKARGGEHEQISVVIKFFGSWAHCKEALSLTDVTTPRRIEARFNDRRMGKIWKYTNDTLAHWLAGAVEEFGRPPQLAEYAWWRERELALAKQRGDDTLHIPSAAPYRKRWGTWPAALLALGYEPGAVDARLERPTNTTGGQQGATARRAPRGR